MQNLPKISHPFSPVDRDNGILWALLDPSLRASTQGHRLRCATAARGQDDNGLLLALLDPSLRSRAQAMRCGQDDNGLNNSISLYAALITRCLTPLTNSPSGFAFLTGSFCAGAAGNGSLAEAVVGCCCPAVTGVFMLASSVAAAGT